MNGVIKERVKGPEVLKQLASDFTNNPDLMEIDLHFDRVSSAGSLLAMVDGDGEEAPIRVVQAILETNQDLHSVTEWQFDDSDQAFSKYDELKRQVVNVR